MCSLFSPEILQAGAVKGLKDKQTKPKRSKKIRPQKPCMFTELIYDHWGVTQDAEPSPIHLITTIRHFTGDRAYVLCPVVSSRGLVR